MACWWGRSHFENTRTGEVGAAASARRGPEKSVRLSHIVVIPHVLLVTAPPHAVDATCARNN